MGKKKDGKKSKKSDSPGRVNWMLHSAGISTKKLSIDQTLTFIGLKLKERELDHLDRYEERKREELDLAIKREKRMSK